MYKIYLRSHAHDEQGRILERIEPTNDLIVAEAAYRRLLNRADLIGEPVAAVLSSDRKSIYFSRFDREPRIHPDAPLDLLIDYDGTTEAAQWAPPAFILPDTPQPSDIAAAREHLGLTQKQLAPLLGYSDTPRISEIETGTRNPSGAVVLLLRAYLSGYRPTDWPE